MVNLNIIVKIDLSANQEMEFSLEHYRNDKKLLAEVVAQLEKDIMLCGGEWTFIPVNYTVEILVAETQRYFKSVSVIDKPLLMNLLYRIDVPQHMLELPDRELTDMILKRELMKVLFRNKY